jgi:phosphoribosylamine--glycine ligase
VKVLVVGNGGREHAIAWKLSQSPLVTQLQVAPGNAGTSGIAENVPIAANDIEGLLSHAGASGIDLTVIGPEVPLAAGIVDRFQEAGLAVFGPTQAAARIESSKVFAKELMRRHGVPTGAAEVFSSYEEAAAYVKAGPTPVVIKPDGLTAGKGVVIAETRSEALDTLRTQMVERSFGGASESVLIEEYLEGREISVFAFVDGEYVSPLIAACDYKRAGDGDTGPNTGGMGSFSPPLASIWTAELEAQVLAEIVQPVARAMVQEGSPFRGVLYLGMIVTAAGPKVIEFNCRLGDPEAQVILPRMKTDLAEVMMSAAHGTLSDVAIEWDSSASVTIVVASGGYPDDYRTGYEISGLDEHTETVVFHAGTKMMPGANGSRHTIVTDGGRVLSVMARGGTMGEARDAAYAGVERIRFKGSFFRRDIAAIG